MTKRKEHISPEDINLEELAEKLRPKVDEEKLNHITKWRAKSKSCRYCPVPDPLFRKVCDICEMIFPKSGDSCPCHVYLQEELHYMEIIPYISC